MTATEIMNMLTDADCKNGVILENLIRANLIFRQHHKIVVSISGGSDSDIVLDICEKVKGDRELTYVWFDTGVEYQATKDHLKYLEARYGIEIKRIKAIKSIPTCCREYGIPFVSKYVSENLERLQSHGFDFTDRPLEELLKEYPQCQGSIMWWCNSRKVQDGYPTSMFNINHNKYLKEFIVANPPTFKISNKCCTYAKKKPAHKFRQESGADVEVIGVRRAEGGARSMNYKSCFDSHTSAPDAYRPVFWYTEQDKRDYEKAFNIKHSECYTKYGFKRTGCVGCPFSRNLFEELKTTKQYEPKLYKACISIFGKSYEYTKAYREFAAEMARKEKHPDQLSIFDLMKGEK